LNNQRLTGSRDSWLEETGEVELIGGWAEVALAADFAGRVDTSDYQVFLTSYDAVVVFVQNRTPRGFEIHALRALEGRLGFATRCGYRVVARRLPRPASGDA
jgi:hypothetical protein